MPFLLASSLLPLTTLGRSCSILQPTFTSKRDLDRLEQSPRKVRIQKSYPRREQRRDVGQFILKEWKPQATLEGLISRPCACHGGRKFSPTLWDCPRQNRDQFLEIIRRQVLLQPTVGPRDCLWREGAPGKESLLLKIIPAKRSPK